MLHFSVQDIQQDRNCQVCCCQQATMKPGTINRLSVDYAPWALPIGQLHCDPQFSLEQRETCDSLSGSGPQGIYAQYNVIDPATDVAGDLKDDVTGTDLVFKLLSLYGPKHGTLDLSPDGEFTYTPFSNYIGKDSAFVQVSDGINPPIIFELIFGVNTSTVYSPTPHVSIDYNSVQVNSKYYTASFGVKISPAAATCEVWRLTILQSVLDCDCICYNRSDCFDIRIAKC